MAKHRREWNHRTYHALIDEGRGQGELKDYRPWLTVQDLASRGVSSRVFGHTTGRIHEFLSRNETAYFRILDASDKVLDIREQYPLLYVEDTVRIAERAGIRHPRDPRSRYPYVMTSDFVITTADGIKVRSVKESSELKSKRVREKLEIERRYWTEREVDWKIVTEHEIDFQKARNLEWVYRASAYCEMLPDGLDPENVLTVFLKTYQETCLSVCRIAEMVEEAFGLKPGMGIMTYQYLILAKRLEVDLSAVQDLVTARVGCGKELYSWIRTYA